MANHKSAEKRARQTERRTTVNSSRRSRLRGSIKKVEEAIKSGDKKAATEEYQKLRTLNVNNANQLYMIIYKKPPPR